MTFTLWFIPVLIIFAWARNASRAYVWWSIYAMRNEWMKKFAETNHLSFQSNLTSAFRFAFFESLGNIPINRVEGDINGHHVVIQDVHRPWRWPTFTKSDIPCQIEIDGKADFYQPPIGPPWSWYDLENPQSALGGLVEPQGSHQIIRSFQ